MGDRGGRRPAARLTDAASWRWIFIVNLPLGALALVVVLRTMRVHHEVREHRIDYAGAAVLSAATGGLLLACAWGGTTYPWGSAPVLGTAAAGLVLLAAFVVLERRTDEPLLPLALFRRRTFAVSSGATFLVEAAMFGVTIYAPVYVQGVIGASATSAGVVLIPLSLGWVAASFASGQVIARTGRYRAFPILGSALVLIGAVLLSTLGAGSSRGAATACLLVVGVGMGSMFQTYVIATQNSVAVSDLGVATAALQFFRSMGGSLAVAALGTLLTNRLASELPDRLGRATGQVDTERLLQGHARVPGALLEGTRAALAASLHSVFLVLVPLAALGLALSVWLPARPLRTESPQS